VTVEMQEDAHTADLEIGYPNLIGQGFCAAGNDRPVEDPVAVDVRTPQPRSVVHERRQIPQPPNRKVVDREPRSPALADLQHERLTSDPSR
jgi:hypothetical protein